MIDTETKQMVREGMSTPWGAAQTARMVIDGIGWVSCAGHGGMKLSRQRNAAMPEYLRRKGGWYEEDCEWSIPFCVFEAEIRDTLTGSSDTDADHWVRVIAEGEHRSSFRCWYPDAYERFYGVQLAPGESMVRDERVFRAEHADDWVAVSAFGSWHANVVEGQVGVVATLGGEGRYYGQTIAEKAFLVPQSEYDSRGRFGFVLDPARHAEVPLATF